MSPLIKINLPSVQQMGDALWWLFLLTLLVATFGLLLVLLTAGYDFFVKVKKARFPGIDYEKEYNDLVRAIYSRVDAHSAGFGYASMDYERLFRVIMVDIKNSEKRIERRESKWQN